MIRRLVPALPALFVATLASTALAQRQADFRWSGALAAGSEVSVNNVNGNIKVVPSTTGRVEVVGIKEGDSPYFDRIKVDVQQTTRGLAVCVIFDGTDSTCDERGYHSNSRGNRGDDRDWNHLAINLEVAIPGNLLVVGVSQLTPLLPHGARHLFPFTFDLIPVHEDTSQT